MILEGVCGGDWRPVVRAFRNGHAETWWAAWPNAPPPRQLQALTDTVAAGRSLHRYIPT